MRLLDYVHFNEQYFPAVSSCAHDYARKIAAGYDRMRCSTVVIAGLARSIASILPATMLRMELLGKTFANYHILIYENDSNDETPAMLREWAATNPRVEIVSEKLGAPASLPIRCSSRGERMAHYRGLCQRRIREKYSSADFVILIDTDLEGGWSPDGIASTFAQDNWDFVGSNGVIFKRLGWQANTVVHFDAWAFRNDLEFKPLSTKFVNKLSFERGQPFVPLPSCFGGLGIYRMEAYLAGEYRGGDIEHVSFHRTMREKGFDRTFLNPSQLVVYGRKHRRLDVWVKRAQRLFQLLFFRRRIPWRFEKTIDYRETPVRFLNMHGNPTRQAA
jgi:glycosyltransferase involved in cell wall biosynthesis